MSSRLRVTGAVVLMAAALAGCSADKKRPTSVIPPQFQGGAIEINYEREDISPLSGPVGEATEGRNAVDL